MNATDGLYALAAAFAAVASLGSWRAARRSSRATETLSDVELERRHGELTPEFKIRLTEGWQGVDDHGLLDIELVGPHGLDYLDEVVIRVLDETGQTHKSRGLPTDPTEEDLARLVWGPWELNTGASVQVADNKTTKPRRYSRADGRNWDRLQLTRTRPGYWMTGTTQEAWQREHPGPLRLSITCQRKPYAPWYLLYEVPGKVQVPES